MGKAKQCDRCGGFYPYLSTWYDGEVAELKTMHIGCLCTYSAKYWDLCPDCTNKLNKWLKNEPFEEES